MAALGASSSPWPTRYYGRTKRNIRIDFWKIKGWTHRDARAHEHAHALAIAHTQAHMDTVTFMRVPGQPCALSMHPKFLATAFRSACPFFQNSSSA
eukprot:350259-Chlamydomonas_euryale.AAC.8